jgi:hypothetical protein
MTYTFPQIDLPTLVSGDWVVQRDSSAIQMIAPNQRSIKRLLDYWSEELKGIASRSGLPIEFFYNGRSQGSIQPVEHVRTPSFQGSSHRLSQPEKRTLGTSRWLELHKSSLEDDDIVTVYDNAFNCLGAFTYPLRRFKSLGVEIGQSVDAEPEVIRAVKKELLISVRELAHESVAKYGFVRLHDFDALDWDYSVEVFYECGEYICKMRDVDPSGVQRSYWFLRS